LQGNEVDKNQNIEKNLEYIGLNLDKIPKSLKKFEDLEFRVPKFYDEKQYRQYKYIALKDIQILLSPTNRLDEIEEKYKKASPIAVYLDSKNEENILKYTTFLNMLQEVRIEEIEKIEQEQENLNKNIPFKVKFDGNYLWQIYYSENTDKYFMLVPTKDANYSTFFYLLKKQLEKKKTSKIFVPIRNVGYSNAFLKKSQFEDIENYLWLFTKDWPLVYEVYDKKGNLSIQIVGETEVYGKIKSSYKIVLNSEEESIYFYKLLKAMFILQTELPNYFNFKTDIEKSGEIRFNIGNIQIQYEDLPKWVNEEFGKGEIRIDEALELIEENIKKLEKLKEEVSMQEIEYLAKEKQISTFLECKKSFFGKFKYYFKYSKKRNNKIKEEKEEQPNEDSKKKKRRKKVLVKRKKANYTIEELIELYKEFEIKETELKNIVMDINSLKLKNKNMKKKIENASLFIQEIDNHKKSIFEFWKYSNKDEIATLTEGEIEEVNIVQKIEKIFDYEEDLEKFGKMMDKIQRKNLSKEEKDSIFIATTNVLGILNKVRNNEIQPKEIEANLKEIKKEASKEKVLMRQEEFDIFGGIAQDSTKVSEINNKRHRELPKDKYNILDISRTTNQIGYKLSLENIIENIKSAIQKVVITEDMPVYKVLVGEELESENINLFNINPEKEIQEIIKNNNEENITFYKINIKRGTNAISYTNCIFYDNLNRTLPVGQDLSSKIIVDLSKVELELKQETTFKVTQFEENENDFSKIKIKTINVVEYDIK